MFPPPSCGGNGDSGPGRSGAVPSVPKNGLNGTATPGATAIASPVRSNVRR